MVDQLNTDIEIRASTEQDLPAVRDLLVEFSLPLEGLECASTWLARSRRSGELIGCIGLEVHGRQGLLRSLAVKKRYQSTGIGTKLVERVLEQAKSKILSEVYLLTETATAYFQNKFGFIPAGPKEKKSLGPVVESKEFSGACPESAVLMMKVIR